MDFEELVESQFEESMLRHEEADAYVLNLWLISPFHHDETDDSFWWLESHYNGVERMGWTGPGKRGIWVTGFQVAVETMVLDYPDSETARGMYFYTLKSLEAASSELPPAYD